MDPFVSPVLDYHALAPELILTGVLVAVLLADLFLEGDRKIMVTQLAGYGLLAALIPVITLAFDGADRAMFGGAYVVDNFALVFKGLFLVTGYVVLLMSADYIDEGDYHKGEFPFMVLASLLGMLVMASSRDLITIFVALELLSIPGYLLAGWRKTDLKSNEASLKYYLLGVLASAVMLYGMSLVYGASGSTKLIEIRDQLDTAAQLQPLIGIGIFFVIVGFAFKVSAVPFHLWAPDTYEGAPTPVTAFLSVASKAAGFVALLQLVYLAFPSDQHVWGPIFWVLAALTMTVGNLTALRQTNIVRMLAYSSVAQAGYILVPFAVAGDNLNASHTAFTASVVYLLLYAAMNLGAFAVVIVLARKTRSGEIGSYAGLFSYAPVLTVLMSVFLFSLAGLPPFGGWFAKFYVIQAVLDSGTPAAIVLGVIVGVNSVIALFYYANIARLMWMSPPAADLTPVRVQPALAASLGMCAIVVVVSGTVATELFARMGHLAFFG